VRFLDPEKRVPDRDEPSVSYPYDNPAYVAAHTGFEVQLCPVGRPASRARSRGVLMGDARGCSVAPERAEVKIGDWNDLEIEAKGSGYSVRLNGKQTAEFSNADSFRGQPASAGESAGSVGVVMRKGAASFRQLEVELLAGEEERAQEQAGQQQPSQKPSSAG
jgi:hypothetical protein